MLFYPIVPIVALFALLWVGPHNKPENFDGRIKSLSSILGADKKKQNVIAREEQYYQVNYLALTARAISGGVQSPLQLIFQVSHHP